MTGKFITFEGGDGVGKTTQARLLYEKLKEYGLRVKLTREPGGGDIGEKIRDVIKSSNALSMDPICEALLLFAARRDHFLHIILPLINDGYIVICDRFYDSSLVYQGCLKKVKIEDLMTLKKITIGDFEPDLTIILDVSSDISQKRRVSRNLISDDYDFMEQDKHEFIRNSFKKIAKIFSFRTVLINADGSKDIIFSKILKSVQSHLNI